MENTIEVIDSELKELLDQCLKEKLSHDEIKNLFLPILDLLGTGNTKESTRPNSTSENSWIANIKAKVKSLIGTMLIVLLFLGAGHYMLKPEFKNQIRSHGLAVIRIGLVKILPYWNWQELYYSRCLIRNPFYEDVELKPDDCNLCETLESIERIWNLSQKAGIEEFIKREKPFVVMDGMNDWPIMRTDHFWFDNITELYLNHEKYTVCNLNTNLRVPRNGELHKVLKQLYSPHTEQWFLHWENCQKDGAKATRQFYKRPYFISNSMDFTGPNWVLMSSEFRGRVYKKLEVRDSLSLLYQMRGSNHIRLSPKQACHEHCPELTFSLEEGEILVVTNLLWNLEYIPAEIGDNLAIVSEVSWPALD